MNSKLYLLKIALTLISILLLTTFPNAYTIYHTPSPGGGGDTESIDGVIEITYSPEEPVAGDPIIFSFVVKDKSTGSIIVHIDYVVKVIKDGNELFRKSFHDHEGDLSVKFVPMDGETSVEGSPAAGGEFTVTGPIFIEPGEYTIVVSVVGIEFSPITPFSNETTVIVGEKPMDAPTQEPPPDEGQQDTPRDTPPDDQPKDGGMDEEDMMDSMPPMPEENIEEEMGFMGIPWMYIYLIVLLAVVGVAVAFLLGRG